MTNFSPREAYTTYIQENISESHSCATAVDYATREILSSTAGIKESPCLGYDTPPRADMLVRFRGFIQDVCRDALLEAVSCSCGQTHYADMTGVYMIPILGESSWVTESIRGEGGGGVMMCDAASGRVSKKCDNTHHEDEVVGNDGVPAAKRVRFRADVGRGGAGVSSKRGMDCDDDQEEEERETGDISTTTAYWFPHLQRSNQPNFGVVLEIPASCSLSPVKLNDIVSGIGFVDCIDEDEIWSCARIAQDMKENFTSLLDIPHVVRIRVLEMSASESSKLYVSPSNLPLLRYGLLSHLTASLGGDQVSAWYLFAHLLSSVNRRPDGIPVGDVPLCLYGVPDAHVPRIIKIIEDLVPGVAEISLNAKKNQLIPTFAPDGFLSPSLLQLPNGTNVILTSSAAARPGLTNDDTVVKTAFETLLLQQVVEYNVPYSNPVQMPVNYPSLVLLNTKQCPTNEVIPVDCKVRYIGQIQVAMQPPLAKDVMQPFREYIQYCRDEAKYVHAHGNSMQCLVEAMTNATKTNDVPFTGHSEVIRLNTFSTWLTLLEIMGKSYGETEWSMTRLEEIFEMERRRGLQSSSL
eukprot:PhF_6_TR14924/c0_g1_i1/m.23336